MSHLTLQRDHETPDRSRTFGAIYDEKGRRECVTLELGWHDNEEGKSRFPAGEYVFERVVSPTHHETRFQAVNIPGRKNIQIHAGCLPCDTEGCVLVATDYGHVKYDDGRPGGEGEGILGARAAFLAFMANHPEQRITLSVLDPSPSLPEHPL